VRVAGRRVGSRGGRHEVDASAFDNVCAGKTP